MQAASRLSRLLLAFVAASQAGVALAQRGFFQEPVDLPDGPAAPGFDIERFSGAGNGVFETFYVEETGPLRQALEDGRLAGSTRMLVLNTAGGNLALVTDQMAFHHLAQGTSEGKHWLATF
jgi:hypothetical protein